MARNSTKLSRKMEGVVTDQVFLTTREQEPPEWMREVGTLIGMRTALGSQLSEVIGSTPTALHLRDVVAHEGVEGDWWKPLSELQTERPLVFARALPAGVRTERPVPGGIYQATNGEVLLCGGAQGDHWVTLAGATISVPLYPKLVCRYRPHSNAADER